MTIENFKIQLSKTFRIFEAPILYREGLCGDVSSNHRSSREGLSSWPSVKNLILENLSGT